MSISRFKPGEKTINGTKFMVYPFNFKEAIKLKAYLMEKIAPSIGQAIGSLKLGEDLQNFDLGDFQIDGNQLGGALQHLFNKLKENEFYELIKRLFKNVVCIADIDGTNKKLELSDENNFDEVFSGKIMDIYPLALFVLKTNYPSFFVKVEGIGSRLKTAMSKLLKEEEKKTLTK